MYRFLKCSLKDLNDAVDLNLMPLNSDQRATSTSTWLTLR